MPTNKIIARGLGLARGGIGNRAGPLTRGYGGRFIEQIIEVVTRNVKGKSGYRIPDNINELVVYAKLIEINGAPPKRKLEGWARVRVSAGYVKSLVEHLATRVRNVLVSAIRIKR